MSDSYHLEKAVLCLRNADEAISKSESAETGEFKKLWLDFAQSWEFIAKLQLSPCFCGEPAVGFSYVWDGRTLALCETHMTEVLVRKALRQAADTRAYRPAQSALSGG